MEQYKTKGKEINAKYCVLEGKTPIMLPPAPKQTYIDVYLDEDDSDEGTISEIEKDRRHQADYEAEAKAYRALDNLKEDILVLHNFVYTHHQYRLCDTNHDRRNCLECKKRAANKDGECDFVVIGRNYSVVIEVKNLPHEENDELTEEKERRLNVLFQNSLKQRERTKCLIDGIVKQVFEETDTEQYKILTVSAFPNTHRILFEQNMDLDEEQNRQIICHEDFDDFNSWWIRNVTPFTSNNVGDLIKLQHETVKEILLAIWCTDKNQCDELKCSLVKCIMDIDEELRKGRITFRSQNRLPNPNVIEAKSEIETANISDGRNIFSDIIGIQNLTAEQVDVFNRDQNLLLIRGPAGSGKTVLILGKIIQLIKSNENYEVLLFIFVGDDDTNTRERYKDVLKKAEIIPNVITADKEGEDTLLQKISDNMQGNQVMIVELTRKGDITSSRLLPDMLGKLKSSERNRHVFVDDCQVALYELVRASKDLPRCKELSATNYRIWFTCDLTQRNGIYPLTRPTTEKLASFMEENCVTISLNLRNTVDLAGILLKIRQFLCERSRCEDKIKMFPMLQPGHLIHGPQTIVHVIENKVDVNDLSLIYSIVKGELDKLCNIGVSSGFKVGVVENVSTISNSTVINKMAEDRASNDMIEYCDTSSCNSAEYPAVVVLHDVVVDFLEALYLEMSRARVYCSVIMYSTSNTLSDNQDANRLLDELDADDSVKIILYD